ncbi:MAG: 23S rRNA (guanosine(2251)-2'-O)-methyltransferase RlmB [Deltaproteobacteria bacterium]|nr:23S rRNA (guanosine(2251)-2'-O)-methyltransferase RlmB [Deltaproteobacteria bacterium]
MASRLILSGFRSIEECLRANPDRIAKILVPAGRLSPRVSELRDHAQKRGVRVEVNPNKADGEEAVLAVLNDYEYAEFDALLDDLADSVKQGNRPVALALDGITDVHNLGAMLRTAAFMGVSAVILPKDRSALINETVYRIASGGLEYLRVTQVTNLVTALEKLKEVGFWSVGFSEHAEQDLAKLKNDFPPVIVIGNEEKGMRQLVKENCDFLVKLVGRGELHSLNASVAAALAMSWASQDL